jgi:hypothetical protein
VVARAVERREQRGERGQAILLALVALVVLAIGMYTTYSLSRAVYEKIQLQNAADATAYSLATLEARTFNFIAFANRAQVANYVQMMEAQSLLSNATYAEAMTARLAEGLYSAGWALIAFGGQSLIDAGQGLGNFVTGGLRPLVDTMDEWTPRYIQLQTTQNEVLYLVSITLAVATALQLADGAQAIVKANDPDAELSTFSYIVNGLNVASYATAFDLASFDLTGQSTGAVRAQRAMAELANASRFGSTVPDFVVARSRLAYFEQVVRPLLGDVGTSSGNGGDVVDQVLSYGFAGTAKLLTADSTGRGKPEDTHKDDPDHSRLAQGNLLLAKDHETPPAWLGGLLDPLYTQVGVESSKDVGRHCRWDKDKPFVSNIFSSAAHFAAPPIKCEEDNKHRWRDLLGLPGGITPYLKFAARLSGLEAEKTSFNQPDVWMVLNKQPASMRANPDRDDLNFTLKQGQTSVTFDGRLGEGGILGTSWAKGMHAIARAQVYYHRPGAWQEPPNFFNPYWGARLAPKNAAIKRLLETLGISGEAAQLVSDNLWMH